ncbi:MAG: hypothetical protein Q9182_001986 [Xanthomendoza sp. 2 TL-2023]
MTPPKSPLKPLPTAPITSTRSSSQQHSRHSSSQSQSRQHEVRQQVKHTSSKQRRSSRDVEPSSPRLERAMSAKRVEPILRDTTPELSKTPKSVEPPLPIKPSGPTTPPEPSSRDQPSESPAAGDTFTTSRAAEFARPSTEISRPVIPPEPTIPTKSTDPIIAAREVEAKPPIPVRSPSRKPSLVTFTERARFHLNRKRSPSKEVDFNDASNTDLPIQSPSSCGSPAGRPSSPVFKRLSTRRANAISISTYSASPTSTSKPSESPTSRNMSPVPQSDSGVSKPSHSSYNSISFLPLHPQLSPLPDYSAPYKITATQASDLPRRSISVNSGTASKRASTADQRAGVRRSSSVTSDAQNRRSSSITSNPVSRRSSMGNIVYPKRSSSINIPNSAPIPDDAGGSVNLQHPLLREARHAKFTTTTTPGTPAWGSSRDLPLRHYHSQDNFHSVGFAARPKEVMLPKRTSSLMYNPPAPSSPSAHPALSSAPRNNDDRLSPAPAQSSATPAPLQVNSRPGTAATARDALDTTRSSPATATSDDSDESEGATPPPISRGVRSPTKSPAATSPIAVKSPTSPPSTKPSSPPEKTKYKTSATNNIPFYLNPVSSAALIDFLASTPPPSPPHPARSNTDPNAFDTQNLYKNYRFEEGSAGVPPGPGGMPMLPLSLAQADPKNAEAKAAKDKKKVWKRMFGGVKGGGAVGGGGGGGGGGAVQKDPHQLAADSGKQPPPPQKKKAKKTKKKKDKNGFEEMLDRGGLKLREDNGSRENGRVEKRDEVGAVDPTTMMMAVGGGGEGDKEKGVSGGNHNHGEKAGGGGGQSFMGVGKDGMWISRKNFLRT